MTNPNLTLIGLLVDRSGSMATIREDMEGGIKSLLDEQRGLPGACEVTIAQFDTLYEEVVPITDISNVEGYTLHPRGGTALNDAMGKFITDLGLKLKRRPENERPGKVVIVVVTDGYENSSTQWTTSRIKELVTQQREQWNWEFLFLGKDIDAFAVAESIGIRQDYTMNFTNSRGAMKATSANLSAYRAGAPLAGYSKKQAEEAMK